VGGPEPGTRLTEAYVREIGRFAYLWGWPMVNVHNRMVVMDKVPEPGLGGGVLPVAPVNQLGMLHDYIAPEQRFVTCPNQDVVYGLSVEDFRREPVVLQVPDFGDRFWVYQVCDQRTDAYADVGAMYGTRPGCYLLVGPDWQGQPPQGIKDVFRCPTQIGLIFPRVFQTDDPADKQAVQPLINQIMAYPLSQFDGTPKTKDWSKAPSFPSQSQGDEEVHWVIPEAYFDELPGVLDEVPPLPGEEALYALIRSVLDAAAADPKLKALLKQTAQEAEEELLKPLFQFHNYGIPLPHNWTTLNNNALFGTDYYSRAAAAKSNMFVNKPNETKYLYQDLDAAGARLNGSKRYTVTYPKGALPPVRGFWSLTLYNEHHFFYPNQLNRYSLGTKNKDLQLGADGSLTLYAQAEPTDDARRTNWLPAPPGDFSLYQRAYWPDAAIVEGRWTPPPVVQS
jgi:hypothetical protein